MARMSNESESIESEALAEVRKVVRRVWGYDTLRPLQAEAMNAALAGRDALVVLATGGGKSLCYQAPALVRPGLTAVISPLISLMQDQIAGLIENGVQAAMLSSAQDVREKRRVYERLAAREVKLVFCAPERLMIDGFFEDLVSFGLAQLVIDEAHCISHWGHDFRPEYRRIGELRARAPEIPIQAFTATATPRVRDDILSQLSLVDPVVLVGGFDRSNLTYRFLPRGDLEAQVHEVIRRHEGEAGIVYCLRRRDVDELTRELKERGVDCLPYHAGLSSEVRETNQERFVNDQVSVIVATIAFGMGIDRSDVRYVVHASLPKGVEQFSQETGRAGRDGLPAECVMFYSAADYYTWRSLVERASEESGDANVDVDAQIARLGDMLRFATGARCRHRYLVEHFGETWRGDERCGGCDVCLGELEIVGDAHVLAQKILSCVVRVGQRFGAAHVTDVLRGSKSEKLRMQGHDRLTTFGLLATHSARDVRGWIEQLVGAGHLMVDSGEYPTLSLSRSGAEVLRNERQGVLFAPPKPVRASKRARVASISVESGDGAQLPVDAELFERLRSLRRRLAHERGVPPYLIFNDRTLAALAARKPRTRDELFGIPGVGEKKAEDPGPLFLAEILRSSGTG